MRILHLVSYHLFSGPIPPTVGLAVAQRAMGHKTWMAIDRKRGHLDNPFEEAAGPSLALTGLTPDVAWTLSTHSSPLEYINDIRRLRTFVRDAAVDVLHVHQSHDHGMLPWLGQAACYRVRTVHAARSLGRRLGQGWLFNRLDGIIVRCWAHQTALLRHHAPRAPVAVVPGSIDGQRFIKVGTARGQHARARWGIPAAASLIGMVALLDDRGQAELLHAVARMQQPTLHVLLAGRGGQEAPLRALVQRLGLAARVHFVGYVQGDALVDAYAACDAMFLAQPGNDAGARAGLEAMAAGVPLLAVATGALAELVASDRGLLSASRAPADVELLLRRWLDGPVAAQASASRAQRYVLEQRSFTAEADATLRFYRSLSHAAPGADPLNAKHDICGTRR